VFRNRTALLVTLTVAHGRFEFFDVFGRQLWPVERDGELADLAGEREWDLVVLVICRHFSTIGATFDTRLRIFDLMVLRS
jgi:hypothetical protein